MTKRVGIYGNAVRDQYVAAKALIRTTEGVEIVIGGESVFLPAPPDASKITIDQVPAVFHRFMQKLEAGGGIVNSRIAAGMLEGTHEIRSLDANRENHFLASRIPAPVRWLGLREAPCNYVFAGPHDRFVVRSKVDGTATLAAGWQGNVDWVCDGEAVLLNSPRDEDVASEILKRCVHGECEALTVLTPSLSADFQRNQTLPNSAVLIGAWDELGFLTGPQPVTLQGAMASAVCLHSSAPGSEIHVTMGRRGVLCVAAGSAAVWHVELVPEVSALVQAHVASSQARLCGAGDAFAAGVLMQRALGVSLMHHSPGQMPSHVAAALAGCVAALRRIGFRRGLTPEDFAVRVLNRSCRRVVAAT